MLAQGVIRPSNSPWSSAVVLARKKGGKWRFFVDYRPLNNVTVKDDFPLPNVNDMLEALDGAKFFSSIDAASGYLQVPLDEDSIPLTAFKCLEGFYEYVRMPFGLCNAPATFQRMMQNLLSARLYRGVLVYIDDILVYASSFEEHLEILKWVIEQLTEAGLFLNADKCRFGMKKVEFLGFVISEKGIHPDASKVEKIKTYPQPLNHTHLRAFIGLGSYYRRFIKNFAQVIACLNDLTTAEDFVWKAEHQEAFSKVKEAISVEAVCHHPDFTRPFILDTDASEIGMGAILSQVDGDGLERIVAVDSRKFYKAESKWHIREKEALGIIWGLERYENILLGCKFGVRTDHSSLKWLQEAKSGRLQRWALRLSPFGTFSIVHRSGEKHTNVDAFTRVFAESEALPDAAFVCSVQPAFTMPSAKEILEAQKDCKACQRLCKMGKTSLRDGIQGMGRHKQWRPIIPSTLALRIAKEYHESTIGGHMGARKLMSLLSRKMIVPAGWGNDQRGHPTLSDMSPTEASSAKARGHEVLSSLLPLAYGCDGLLWPV